MDALIQPHMIVPPTFLTPSHCQNNQFQRQQFTRMSLLQGLLGRRGFLGCRLAWCFAGRHEHGRCYSDQCQCGGCLLFGESVGCQIVGECGLYRCANSHQDSAATLYERRCEGKESSDGCRHAGVSHVSVSGCCWWWLARVWYGRSGSLAALRFSWVLPATNK